MKRLCQRDLHWCNNKLGSSNLSIAKAGCTTCCISMLSDYFGQYITPDTIAKHLDWYTKDGLILWSKLFFGKFRFDLRGYGQNDVKIQEYLKDPKKAVILEVNNNSHWVVTVKRALFSKNNYIVADPWLGKDVNCKKVYKNITGYSLFSKK